MANKRPKLVTQLEAKRAFDDRAASIDRQMDDAIANINWDRRKAAEKDINAWVRTYCIPLLIDDAPPKKGVEVLKEMREAITSHSNYMICMPRGSGKSSYVECITLYALATGLQDYVCIVSQNATSAKSMLNDIWRVIAEHDTPFANDYPHITLPFQLCNGSYRRRQLYRGVSTDIAKNAAIIQFARLRDNKGNEVHGTGSVITVRGISSGLRGMKHGTKRPSLILLDDLQTSEIAESPEQVEKLVNLIKKDVMNLGGKNRLSILQTATPICPDDLVERLKKDISWKTTVYKAIEHYPRDFYNKDGHWARYFTIWDAEQVSGESHTKSLEYYRDHKDEMDMGSEVFNPQRFSPKDGHISAIQKLLEIRHTIGDAAFDSEHQMQPKRQTVAIDLTPQKVISKITTDDELTVPDGYTFVSGAIDINASYAMTCTLVAYRPDTTAHVIWHGLHTLKVDQRLPDMAYNASIHEHLQLFCDEISALGIKIDGLAIDAGGRNWDAVCNFAKVSKVGFPVCAFGGRSATMFNPFVRTRLRDAIGKTVLCGDAQEHIKRGAGHRYVLFDADHYKETAQRALMAAIGAQGSLSIYKDTPEAHSDFALQVCNERLISKRTKAGRDTYRWKTKEPHDYLDTLSMCYAVASSQGLSGVPISTSNINPSSSKQMRIIKRKPKIRLI